MLVAIAAIGASQARSWIAREVAPPATTSSFVATESYTPEQKTFLSGLKPTLDVLVGEGIALNNLGTARSRNVVELAVRMDRYRTAAGQIERFLQKTPIPPGFEALVAELREQIGASLAAIDASIEAIRQFDWDELAIQVSAFSSAINQITDLAGTPTAAESLEP